MERTIQIKHNIGNTVYVLMETTVSKSVTCPVCKGKGKIRYAGNMYDCPSPDCLDGNSYEYYGMWVPTLAYITGIVVNGPDCTVCGYTICVLDKITYPRNCKIYPTKDVFGSEEEAQAECDRRNEIDK